MGYVFCEFLLSKSLPSLSSNYAKSISIPIFLQKEYYQDIFDHIAELAYCLLDKYAQYQHYLEHLNLQIFSSPHCETPQDLPEGLSSDSITRYVYVYAYVCIYACTQAPFL